MAQGTNWQTGSRDDKHCHLINLNPGNLEFYLSLVVKINTETIWRRSNWG